MTACFIKKHPQILLALTALAGIFMALLVVVLYHAHYTFTPSPSEVALGTPPVLHITVPHQWFVNRGASDRSGGHQVFATSRSEAMRSILGLRNRSVSVATWGMPNDLAAHYTTAGTNLLSLSFPDDPVNAQTKDNSTDPIDSWNVLVDEQTAGATGTYRCYHIRYKLNAVYKANRDFIECQWVRPEVATYRFVLVNMSTSDRSVEADLMTIQNILVSIAD